MKRLLLFVLLLSACKTAAPTSSGLTGNVTGAASPRAAVELFLGAVRAQDLQAMSAIWGEPNGLARDLLPRDELEKRELIMQCYLGHDKFRIVSDAPAAGGKRNFQVALTKGSLTRTTTITAVQGPSDRWYVGDADLAPVKDLCAAGSGH